MEPSGISSGQVEILKTKDLILAAWLLSSRQDLKRLIIIYEILIPGKLLSTDTVFLQSQNEGFFRFQSTVSTWQTFAALKAYYFQCH